MYTFSTRLGRNNAHSDPLKFEIIDISTHLSTFPDKYNTVVVVL